METRWELKSMKNPLATATFPKKHLQNEGFRRFFIFRPFWDRISEQDSRTSDVEKKVESSRVGKSDALDRRLSMFGRDRNVKFTKMVSVEKTIDSTRDMISSGLLNFARRPNHASLRHMSIIGACRATVKSKAHVKRKMES